MPKDRGPLLFRLVIAFAFVSTLTGVLPRFIQFGPISGLGVATLLACLFAMIAWLAHFKANRRVWSIALPLVLFVTYDQVGWLWSPTELAVLQDAVVWGGLLFLFLVAAEYSVRSPEYAVRFATAARAYVLPAVLIGMVFWIAGIKDPASPLLALIPAAFFLAELRLGSTTAHVYLWALMLAMAVIGARTPVFATLGLYLLALTARGPKGNVVMKSAKLLALSVVAALVAFEALQHIGTFRESFEQGDQALHIFGYTINTSGRLYYWQLVWQSALEAPWFGSGTDVPDTMRFIEGWTHPHNDYLRLLHHLGVVGLLFWLVFSFRVAVFLGRAISAAWLRGDYGAARLYYMGVYFLIAVHVVMLTDNVVVYNFVMYPMALILGLGIGVAVNRKHVRVVSSRAPVAKAGNGIESLVR